jgi:hypothetical protein
MKKFFTPTILFILALLFWFIPVIPNIITGNIHAGAFYLGRYIPAILTILGWLCFLGSIILFIKKRVEKRKDE